LNALDQLNSYLQRLEKRLRFLAVSKGTSLVTVSALVITVVLVWIINRYAFSPASLLTARILLFLSVAVAIAFGLVIPLLSLNRRNTARKAEQKFPEFQERLLTLAEKPNTGDPFSQLLAADTMRIAESSEPERLASSGPIFGFLASAAVAVAVLLWLINAGPGYLGYGTSLLWAGAPKSGNHAFYDIAVTPGDRTVRRKADQLVTAQLFGFDSPKVRLFAQYRGTSKWEQVDMQPSPGASTYEFLFSSLADNVEYYVAAGAVESKHYNLRVVDLPSIKKIRVTYHYPSWTGMKDSVEDPGGDLRAVEGTEAEVAILTDRPLSKGVLMLGEDKQIELKPGEGPGEGKDGNWVTAKVTLDKDGLYHIAAIDRGENVRLSEDFFIEARKDSPPTVKIDRPGRDAKVNPIEEVTITVNADDDFALNEVALHYSVNGGPEKTQQLLSQKGVKTASGKYVLALEDYKLAPGDLVSVYAEAKDARNTTKTDIYFIQAEPFERNYSQAQSGGGGGMGGGGDDQQISQRQKDIIAATWNEYKNGSKDPSVAADDAKFLADQEDKLAAQAKSLADRMKARELADANPQFQSFTKEMTEASQSMLESAQKIRGRKWTDAMPPEQKALQEAQRAEATFRDIQVAFGTQGGGGGGAGGAGRDLENLADLELDREKNQYETGQQSASDSRSQEIDKALQKLAELARRQQELAAKKDQQQPFRQRWEQEMLRREAEQLQKQMEQLQRGDQSQQQSGQQGQQSQQGQKGQQGQAGQSGQQGKPGQSGQSGSAGQVGSIASPQLQQALDRLKKATEDMQNAESQQNGSPEQTAAGQRRAADRLQEARDLLNGMQHQNSSQQLDDLAQQANQLAQQQADSQTRLRKMVGTQGGNENPRFGSQGIQNQQDAERLAAEKNAMADQLKKLEQGISETARSMAGAQNPAGNKLREALGDAQQNELEMHLRQDAQFIRQGYGSSAWVRENSVSQGLNNLRDQLQQAQAANQQAGKPGGAGGDDADLEKALARVEAMRSRMQQLAEGQQGKGRQPGQQEGQGQGRQSNPLQRGNQNGNGQQPGQSQQGQSAQSGQQPGQGQQGQNGQSGQQPGQGQQGQSAQNGNGTQAGPNSGYAPFGGGGPVTPGNGYSADGPLPIEQAYRESLRDLNQMRDFVRQNPDFQGDYSNLSRALNPGYTTNDAELSQRLSHEVLPEMERLELELRRKLEDKNSDQVRSAGSETVPPGYSDAVADYFRKLSKSK
jgi:hypothetical protein